MVDHFFRLPRVCIATASPAKFPEPLEKAGIPFDKPESIAKLFQMETKFDWMRKNEDWERMLRERIVDISKRFMSSQ